ncbi:MAG: hypothetical protein JXR95_11155 [Deltaproteobacteria bacterium]|nr:hypothetical protein [Deltaproteobacteria bacterium]
MFKIEKQSYGYLLHFSGNITDDEMKKWVSESEKILKTVKNKKFGIFVDMRDLKPLSPSAKEIMVSGQAIYKTAGMERSVVVVKSAVLKLQFKRIAKESGIDKWERYISSDENPDWQKLGEEWLVSGKDPD